MLSIRNIVRIGTYAGLTVMLFLFSFFLGNGKAGKLHSGLTSYVGIPTAEAETTIPGGGQGGGGGACGCSSSGASTGSGGSGSACAGL